MALTVIGSGYSSSYEVSNKGREVTVLSVDSIAESEDGILLPYPGLNKTIKNGKDYYYNVLNIDFLLQVNGGGVTFSATNVQVPEFKPGHHYRFIVELDYDPTVQKGVVHLLLSIERWSSASWQSAKGGDVTGNLMQCSLGSWSSVSWRSAKGGANDAANMLITSVSGWSSVTWVSDKGK
jgi:hypothetical protein